MIKHVHTRGCPMTLHIPESLGSERKGQPPVGDRGNWLKLSHWSIWINRAG
jgi:hypothetical protein